MGRGATTTVVGWLVILALGCGGESRRAAAEPSRALAAEVTTARVVEAEGTPEDAAVESVVVEAVVAPETAGSEAAPPPAPVAVPSAPGAFFGHDDERIRRALANERVTEVRRGGGGRSLSFRVTLADGTQGYFKPAQTFNGMRWQSEIAAYHLDREIGLGRVAPVVGRRIAWESLEPIARQDGRVGELLVEDGDIPGAFVWWVPERLTPVALPQGWERWLRVEGDPDPITPFQRPNEYRAASPRPAPEDVPEPDRADRPAELSDLIVFDYLIQNLDRWGGHNTNVRTVGPGGPIMFLDNAAGFVLRRPRVELMDTRLAHVQRFRRSTIDALRAFDVDRFAARLAADPLAPELDARQLRNLETRRRYVIAHVDALVRQHGEDAVYAW